MTFTLFENANPMWSVRHTTPYDRVEASLVAGQVYTDQHAVILEAALYEPGEGEGGPDYGPLAGCRAIKRLRVTVDTPTSKPYSVSLSWFPTDLVGAGAPLDELCPLLLETGRLQQGTSAYIREHTGLTINRGFDQVAIGMAAATEAEALGVAVGTPVRRTTSLMYAGDVLVEYAESSTASQMWAEYYWKRD